MVNAVNFNNYYFYGEQKTSHNHNNGFSTGTDIGSKYTDISVRNNEHKFTRLEALRMAPRLLVFLARFRDAQESARGYLG